MKRYLSLIFVLGLSIISAQNCGTPSSFEYLDVNNVKAGLSGGGGMWMNLNNPQSEFYIPNDTSNFASTLFSGGIFLSGKNINSNEYHSAGCFYQIDDGDFWAGPINQSGEFISTEECELWNRHFKINKSTIDSFKLNLFPAGQVPTIINEWPAKGNAYLQNQGFTLTNDYAPFYDFNSNGQYDPENGDYPLIKGDQAVYWVFNDNQGQFHNDFGGKKMGVEVQMMAYAYRANDILNDNTFYDFKIINKSNVPYRDFYFSQFIDPDISGSNTNYTGVDTANQFVFTYNFSDCIDCIYSYYVLTGFICAPNESKLSSYYISSGNDADTNMDIQRCQGEFSDSIIPRFPYPGNPSNALEWSEYTANNQPNDRRYLMNYGPFDFFIGQEYEFTLMVSPILTYNVSYNVPNVATDFVVPFNYAKQKYFEKETSCGFKETITGIKNEINNIDFSIYPNPSSDGYFYISSSRNGTFNYTITNTLGQSVQAGSLNKSLSVVLEDEGLFFLNIFDENSNLHYNHTLINLAK